MSNYTRVTNFTVKDALTTGDPEKLVSGQEIQVELDAIAVAIASKENSADAGGGGGGNTLLKSSPLQIAVQVDAVLTNLFSVTVSADTLTEAGNSTPVLRCRATFYYEAEDTTQGIRIEAGSDATGNVIELDVNGSSGEELPEAAGWFTIEVDVRYSSSSAATIVGRMILSDPNDLALSRVTINHSSFNAGTGTGPFPPTSSPLVFTIGGFNPQGGDLSLQLIQATAEVIS